MSQSLKKIRIGSRGSMLALAQCQLIKEEMEQLSSREFEIITIKTQGDLQTDKPLWQMDGKDFFTKELDHALLNGDVDCVVHSYKDLGSERPEGIHLGAITKRQFPLDVLLISKQTIVQLQKKKWEGAFVVGTSSPRRITNITDKLSQCLPLHPEKIETKMLRGNVNTRIEKLREGQFDAIVLAHAGLERLARNPNTRPALEGLVDGLDFQLLTSDIFPPAASQGALAIECRKDDADTLSAIDTVHCEHTKKAVAEERKRFASYGGGCHLAVGIHAMTTDHGVYVIEKGEVDSKKILNRELLRENPSKTSDRGFNKETHVEKFPLAYDGESFSSTSFLTTAHAIGNLVKKSGGALFSSGVKTMALATEQGHWVNGCSDVRGESSLKDLTQSEFLKAMGLSSQGEWSVLGPQNGTSELGTVIESYTRKAKSFTEEEKKEVESFDHFWWNSFYEYEYYTKEIPNIKNKVHCCGLGKTLKCFEQAQIDVIPFARKEDFLSWLEEK